MQLNPKIQQKLVELNNIIKDFAEEQSVILKNQDLPLDDRFNALCQLSTVEGYLVKLGLGNLHHPISFSKIECHFNLNINYDDFLYFLLNDYDGTLDLNYCLTYENNEFGYGKALSVGDCYNLICEYWSYENELLDKIKQYLVETEATSINIFVRDGYCYSTSSYACS